MIMLETGPGRTGDILSIKTKLEVLPFSLLGFGEGLFNPWTSHDLKRAVDGGKSTLLLGLSMLFGDDKRRWFYRIRVAAHPFIVPPVK